MPAPLAPVQRSGGHRATAMTLLETLLVVVILGAAVAATIGVAGPMSAGQQRLAAISAVREAHQRARLLAEVSGGGVELSLGSALEARTRNGRTGRIQLPTGWRAELEVAEDATASLPFDEGGASADAVVRLVGPNGAFAELDVLGISGQVVERRGGDAVPGAETR